MKGIGKIALWLFLWPILLPIWAWKRGKGGKIFAAAWVLLLLIVGVIGSSGSQRSSEKATQTPKSANVLVQTNTPLPSNTPRPSNMPQPSNTPGPSNTPAPTDTPAPTKTLAPTNTPRPTSTFTPVPKPVVLKGVGQTATDQFVLPASVSIARFTHDGQSNFIVRAYQTGSDPTLLVNTIGAYRGECLLSGTAPVMLDIKADGAWTVEVRAIEPTSSAQFSGTGDAVSGLFEPPSTGPWDIKHSGQANFIVRLYCAGGSDLVQNEIGMVNGSRVMQFFGGPCLWEVRADGAWSLAPRGAAQQRTTTPAQSVGASTKATSPGNLRAGPGTNYAVVGGVKAGDVLGVSGRNSDGTWLLVTTSGSEAWISAQLVEPVPAVSLPVKTSSAPTAAPAPQPTAAPPAQFNAGAFPQIGQEVEGGGWRFKVLETHKRKAVYLYDTAYIAQGHFLVLIIEAVNLQPGTSYFAENVDLYLTDVPGKSYSSSGKGSSYAAWQYTKDSVYDDVNPGVVSRMAIAFDLPDNLGDVLVSTGKLLRWIYLGNFAQMKSEDS